MSVSVSSVYYYVCICVLAYYLFIIWCFLSVSRVSCVQYGLILNISSEWIGALGVQGGGRESSGGEMKGGGAKENGLGWKGKKRRAVVRK